MSVGSSPVINLELSKRSCGFVEKYTYTLADTLNVFKAKLSLTESDDVFFAESGEKAICAWTLVDNEKMYRSALTFAAFENVSGLKTRFKIELGARRDKQEVDSPRFLPRNGLTSLANKKSF